MATCSPWLLTPSTRGSCQLSCRPNLADRGFCKDVPVPTPTTLLSLRPPCVSPFRRWQMHSQRLIVSQVCPSTTEKCHRIQCGNFGYPTAFGMSAPIVPVLRQMQIKDHAEHLGVEIGPGAAGHRWTKARNTFVGVCAHPHLLAEFGPKTCLFQDVCPVCRFFRWICR